MNEHRINGFSEIQGKTTKYTPFNFVQSTDEDYNFTNVIAVFVEPCGFMEFQKFKVEFYSEFTKDNFINDTQRVNHTVYFIKSTKKSSKSVIADIKLSDTFNP
jgi:hypothetical protein